MTIRGTHGDDNLTGTSGNDNFALWQGGNDTLDAGDGNDLIRMGAALNAGDKIDGGAGRDVIGLNGDYSAGLVFNADTITNIEVMNLVGGHSYNLTLNDGNVVAGQSLLVNAGGLGAGDQLTFDGSAETDGRFNVVAGAGDDLITGGAQGDRFHLDNGGIDTANGGDGNDVFYLGGSLWSDDQIDGGAGFDAVHVNGGFAGGDTLALTGTTMQNVEDFVLDGGSFLAVITDDATVAAGATLTVDASAVTGAFTFDGSAETDGQFNIIASSGDDTLTGGAGNDTFRMGAIGLQDQIDGGAGIDTVILAGMGDDFIPFTPTTMVNVEKLVLQSGHDYDLITDDATVAAGQRLLVDGSALHAGDVLAFDGSGETDGAFKIIGGAANDFLTGGDNNDVFDLAHGGNDHATGGGGDDRFFMGAALTAADRISGGSGYDTVVLDGGAAVTFAAATITGVERILLDAGHSYSLTTNNGNVASNNGLTVDASALGAGDTLTFNGSAENNGFFNIIGGAGNDVITGGQDGDFINLSHGGNDTVTLGGTIGPFANQVYMGAALTAADHINGSAGFDFVFLNGDYTGANAVVFNATTMVNVDDLELAHGHSYDLTTNDGNVSAGGTMVVDFYSFLGAGDSLKFDGSAETDGSFQLYDGRGNDVLKGGGGNDYLNFDLGGTDVGQGGGGDDFIDACGHFDVTDQFDGGTGTDTIELTAFDTSTGNYTGVNALVLTASMMSNIEVMDLDNGGSYDITTVDANVAAGSSLTVDGSFLDPGDSLTFDGSAETDGTFDFIAGASLQILLKGGAGDDTFDLTGADPFASTHAFGNGGNDTFYFLDNFDSSSQIIDGGTGTNTLSLDGDYSAISLVSGGHVDNIQTVTFTGGHSYTGIQVFDDVTGGGTLTFDATDLQSGDTFSLDASLSTDAIHLLAGDGTYTVTGSAQGDTFDMGAHFTASDSIDGGAGNDKLDLDGDYSGANALAMGATTMVNVETLFFEASHNYDITADDANVASGQTLTVDAGELGAGDTLTFDGSAETDGSFNVIGGAGDDALTGGSENDTFTLAGGNDTAHGGGGEDTFSFFGAFTAADTVDGGAGSDTISLSGDYSAGVTLGATTMTSVENIVLAAGNSYNLTTDDANVASGASLTVDATALTGTNILTFNGSAETDGTFTFDINNAQVLENSQITGGAGDDTLVLNGDFFTTGVSFNSATIQSIENITLTAGNSYSLNLSGDSVATGATIAIDGSALGAGDHFYFGFDTAGGADSSYTLTGGAGDDGFFMLDTLSAADKIDGGSGGNDEIQINGDYTAGVTFNADTIQHIGYFAVLNGNSYSLTENDGNVAAGATMAVTGSILTASDYLHFYGAAETDGHFDLIGGAGDDVLQGGSLGDTITGGAGADTFLYTAVSQSTGATYDTITDFAAGTDHFDLTTTVTGIFAVSGSISSATFNSDLAALHPINFEGATIVNVTGGDLSGETFLVVDGNGDDTYTAGQDYVFDISHYTGTITTGDFI